jgi:hypothetical protein
VLPDLRPQARTRRSNPRLAVRASNRTAIVVAARYGLTGGVAFGLLARAMHEADPLRAACAAIVVYSVAAACGAGLWAWLRFRTAHLVLAMRGWLPWRPWAFLEDAHLRGAMRQAGTAWQFRHALLQDRLAHQTYLDHLRRRTRAGDVRAAMTLAGLLIGGGQVDQAITILRTRADAGDRDAARQLNDLLARHNRTEDLRQRADAGDQHAARRLAAVLADGGQVDQAITILRTRGGTRDPDAARQLRDLLIQHNRIDDLGELADAGDWQAAERLIDLLVKDGRIEDLRLRAERDWMARRRLAELLARDGRVGDLRERADAGDSAAAQKLAELLARDGRVDDLRERADAGDSGSTPT